MSSVMPISPYCAWEPIGGTSIVPRTIVGYGDTVADGAAVAEAETVGVGVMLVLAGETQARTATDPAIRRAAVLTAVIFAYEPSSRSARLLAPSIRI